MSLKNKHDCQRSFNFTRKRFHEKLLQQIRYYLLFWACICRLRYQACYAHPSYCDLCPASLHKIFPRYLIKFTIF